MEKRMMTLMLLAAATLAGCGGGNDVSTPTPPKLLTNIAVPNASSPPFSFDISYVEAGKYFLSDRNNKAVDVVDTGSNTLIAQIPGPFIGAGATTDESGPDGIVGVTGTNTIYVGDVDSVKVIDTAAQKTVNTIVISQSGSRVDEGCYDPDDHLVMFASPGDSPPFVTLISTLTQTAVAKLSFNGSSGLEACVYDPASKSFLINNDWAARLSSRVSIHSTTHWRETCFALTSRHHDVMMSYMNADRNSQLPLYAQVETVLAARIADGTYPPGTQLPNEASLLASFNISRTTLQKTVQNLIARGLIEIRRGKGTFVTQPRLTQPLTELSGFVEDMRAHGRHPSARLLGRQVETASEAVAGKLALKPGTPVVHIQRVRIADGTPLSFDETWLPKDIGEKIIENDLEAEPIFTLLEEKYGVALIEAEYRLEAIAADAAVARALEVDTGSPIFLIERTSYSDENRPVDYEKLYYRGDQIQFVTRLARRKPNLP